MNYVGHTTKSEIHFRHSKLKLAIYQLFQFFALPQYLLV